MKLQKHYPVKLLCAWLGLARSSWYYRVAVREEPVLQRAVETIVAQYPTYGARRVQHQLRRDHVQFRGIGRKRVRRVLGELGLEVRRKPVKHKTTDSQHPYPRYPNLVKELEPMRPEQVWVGDITYIKLGDGTFVFLAILMDVYTRIIRGWALSRSLGAELTLLALQRALLHGVPEIHHSDQGVQYAATDYVTLLKAHAIEPSMAAVGCAEENGYAERVFRTIKEEEVALNEYPDFETAQAQLGHFIDHVYLHKRIHSSLGYLTPAEFAAQWQTTQASSILKQS
jgi:transposase InsO family protein